ncbi:hypothetical protein CERSUDRAFT_71443 [Gelatoporia subvermispora B]|uniref:Uncharacterized protein n=1 Tax=Ceriporiopsis subvermispora (strain B) TaxID=914234 RepID=M2QR43_CERS8|nr:hypothetical protein CERSUDRAFT_71443 [Gelatoporia subvermispora B]
MASSIDGKPGQVIWELDLTGIPRALSAARAPSSRLLSSPSKRMSKKAINHKSSDAQLCVEKATQQSRVIDPQITSSEDSDAIRENFTVVDMATKFSVLLDNTDLLIPDSDRMVLVVVASISCVGSIPQNVTVDDTHGDPTTGEQFTYTPSAAWSEGQSCPGCSLQQFGIMQQSSIQLFDGTSHFSMPLTGNTTPTASITFSGTAIWVYGVVPYFLAYPSVPTTNLSFKLDGSDAGNFVFSGVDGNPIFNFLLFHQDSLSATSHEFTLTLVGEPEGSLIILDYMVYTASSTLTFTTYSSLVFTTSSSLVFTTPSSAASATNSSGVAVKPGGLSHVNHVVIVVVITVGSILVLTIIGAMWYWRRWHLKRVTVRSIFPNSSVNSLHGAEATGMAHANEIPPPANEILPPATEIPTPANEVPPPANEVLPPANEISPPENEASPSANEISPADYIPPPAYEAVESWSDAPAPQHDVSTTLAQTGINPSSAEGNQPMAIHNPVEKAEGPTLPSDSRASPYNLSYASPEAAASPSQYVGTQIQEDAGGCTSALPLGTKITEDITVHDERRVPLEHKSATVMLAGGSSVNGGRDMGDGQP